MSSSVIYDTHPHNINGIVKNGSSIVLEKSSSDRNHIQFSTAISEKPPLQHSANNLDYMDLEYKPTVPTVSQVDEVVTEKGSSNSFQQPSNLMRYHSCPSSFFATLAEEENNQIISQYFVNESPNAAGQVLKQAQPNHSRALNYQKMQDQPVKQLGEQSNYVPRSPSLKRNGGNIPRDDTVKHTLHAILEHVPDLPHESYNTSSLPMMTQAQVSQSSGQSLESYHQNPVCSNNLGRPGYPANDYSSMPKMSLIRHSSSPAGLLSELLTDQGSFECEYGEGAVKSSMEMINPARDTRLPNRAPRHMPCVRQNSSPSGFLSQLSRDAQAAESQDRSPSDNGLVGTGNSSQGYIPKLPIESWGDGGASPNFAGLQNSAMFGSRKRARDFDEKARHEMNQSEAQGYYPINLPRSASADLAMEDFMHEAVPCKVRAKRGCATHPRSIAERVRRTRISERMRKLQDLVPNSDKQTVNIADMLDEAVEYVKTLQKQVQELTDKKDKCTCMHKPDCEYKT